MDNISRRLSSEDTAASMYLSFDAESTMSTACYKTLEAMSDISALSSADMDNSVNKTEENHLNSTLEAHDSSQIISPLKTVKKMELSEVKLNTPLRALPKNILKEYKALCSTPSKEQLLKSVDVTRGSDANRCIDLGLAFLGVDDEKPAYFPLPPNVVNEENKENALPEVEEVSTLSTCSSVEITATSVIERKMLSSVSTVGSITEEESVDEVKIIKNIEEIKISTESVEESKDIHNLLLEEAKVVEIENTNLKNLIKQNNENTPKAKFDNKEIMEIADKEDKTPVVNELDVGKKSVYKKSSSKPKIAVLTRNARRSTCEPNLQTNKPSRLLNSGYKRKSLLPTSRKSTLNMDAELEIPLLMNKILKITNDNTTPMATEEVEHKEQEQQKPMNELKSNNIEKRRSVLTSMKTRSSLIPSTATAGDKRPFSFTQRMSVVVKTTLNSPARKMARKSSTGVMSSMQRRSVIPQKTINTESSKLMKPEINARKSMLPRTTAKSSTTKQYTKTMATLQETSTVIPNPTIQKKSVYPLAKDTEKGKATSSNNKIDISYTCTVCKEKFRIKSLLDAHKRSHESDSVTPAFIKKSTVAPLPSSVSSNANQCKYCDKKFALTKALHIHLLQNCSKIPPSEKRKLQYTDLNHVEKAQLPNVFSHHHHNVQSNASSAVSSTYATPRHAVKPYINSSTLPKSSTESINENKDIQKITSELVTTVDGTIMTVNQTSVKKVTKKTAHAGVYRTPSKSVPCHLCKLTFKSILDYTNHNLTVHGSNKNITENNEKNMEIDDKVATID